MGQDSFSEELRPRDFSYLDAISMMGKCEKYYIDWISHELQNLLEFTQPHDWVKKEGELFAGNVLEQYIGTVYHKHTKHVYTCLYIASDGPAVFRHGHAEVLPNGDIKKTKEWYIFSDGHIEFCNKDDVHDLVNNSNKPIYVISVKVTGRGHRREE